MKFRKQEESGKIFLGERNECDCSEQVLLLGRILTAQEAKEIGLVTEVLHGRA